ncbi:MAG: hypothetical protein KC546_02085 [Anaerolineae bacterium]|nr:hypothetical protein [Anaerolineae bacterium]MCA9887125.1 hypothetical protein [Anaerolineae bacterium]
MSVESQTVWMDFIQAYEAYKNVINKLMSTADYIEDIRQGLENPRQREAAIVFLQYVSEEDLKILFEDILAVASFSHGLTDAARQVILKLPVHWLLQNIERSAEKLLSFETEEEYRGLFEIYIRLDLNLAKRLAQRALSHSNMDIQEAGKDFMKIIQASP